MIHRGRHLGWFPSQNLGFGGAFIEAGFLNRYLLEFIDLPQPEIVELVFEIHDDTVREYAMEAVVAYRDEDGLGLMFHDYDLPTFQVLGRLLLGHHSLLEALSQGGERL